MARTTAQTTDARDGAQLEALYSNASVGLGFWDSELRPIRANDVLAEVVPELAPLLEPIARRVLEMGEPTFEHQLTLARPGDPSVRREWLVSYYPVLAAGGEVIGVGGIVEEVTARRQAERRSELQRAVSRALATAGDLRAAISATLDAVCEVAGWDAACYWPCGSADGPVARSRASLLWNGLSTMGERGRLSPATLPGRVVASRAPEWAADLHSEGPAAVADTSGLRPRSAVAFPVEVEGELAGVVEVFSCELRAEDAEFEASLVGIGNQLGQFMRRMRAEDGRRELLRRERRARADAEASASMLARLEQVSAVGLKHLPLPELLQALLDRIVEVMQADMAITLLTGDDGLQHVRATAGVDAQGSDVSPIPAGAGITGRVASSRQPLVVPDLSRVELAGTILTRRGVNSLVSAPLLVADRVSGVIHVGSEAYAQFTEEDGRLLGLIADRVALAIDQASLADAERAAQERLRLLAGRLAFLAEASALLGLSLDVDATLSQLGELVAGRAADWCTIHLADEGGPRLVAAAHPDPARAAAGRQAIAALRSSPDASAGVGHVIATGQAELHPVLAPDQLGAAAREAGVHSTLIVPLVARGRTLGAMSWAWAETDGAYDQGDLEFALDLAGRAAVAIDNAQLYAEADERAQAARVLESVGDGVFLVDRAGIVRTWNRTAATATGLPARSVLGRPAVEAIRGWAAVAGRVPVAPAGSAAQRAESLPLDLGGGRELWLSLHGVAVPDGTVYAFRDLTDERALETMRTEFVSTVSHELRTPLAAIYGAAMTLRRSDVALDDAQRARMLDVVSGEADRLARTVNDILWASRLDAGSLHVSISTCDLPALAREVIEAQRAHLDRAHELLLVAADDVPPVSGDPDKVGRILINLLDNAIKYSPDGGRVELRVRSVGGNVRLSVIDPGLGIPVAERRRVFEKFYRLDPDMTRGVGGTGLGLYICRELVRRMGGRIWVESAGLGRGSTFQLELPTAE